MKKLTLLLLLCALYATSSMAQNKFGLNNVAVFGDAEFTWRHSKNADQFGDVNFKPIFMWKLSDKLFIESEVEIETGDGNVNVGLEYANMCYIVNPYLTLHAGRFLPKFGAYRGRLAEGFLNRFADNPVGFGDGGIGASVETGIGALGCLPFGKMQVVYDVYVVNGPHLIADSANGNVAGQFDYEAYIPNNNNKAIGGRVGLLPLSSNNLEIAYSVQNKSRSGDIGSPNEKVSLMMQAVDINYYQIINPLKSTLRIIGEYRMQKVGNNAIYYGDVAHTDSLSFKFNNSPSCFYVSASVRPTQSDNKFLHNLELAYRYSSFTQPAAWGNNITCNEVALNYWLKWNCVIKAGYQHRSDAIENFYAQFVYGF
ncbi:MAG: hypothetical protein RJA07_1611 [Bacteroidota bacterium]|jgi:hypothetical protein